LQGPPPELALELWALLEVDALELPTVLDDDDAPEPPDDVTPPPLAEEPPGPEVACPRSASSPPPESGAQPANPEHVRKQRSKALPRYGQGIGQR